MSKVAIKSEGDRLKRDRNYTVPAVAQSNTLDREFFTNSSLNKLLLDIASRSSSMETRMMIEKQVTIMQENMNKLFKNSNDSMCKSIQETHLWETERKIIGNTVLAAENVKSTFGENNCSKTNVGLELDNTEVYPITRGEKEKKPNKAKSPKRSCERFGCPHRGLLKCSR